MKGFEKNWKYWLKVAALLPLTFFSTVTLRHAEVIKKFYIAAILYMLFVVFDTVNNNYHPIHINVCR